MVIKTDIRKLAIWISRFAAILIFGWAMTGSVFWPGDFGKYASVGALSIWMWQVPLLRRAKGGRIVSFISIAPFFVLSFFILSDIDNMLSWERAPVNSVAFYLSLLAAYFIAICGILLSVAINRLRFVPYLSLIVFSSITLLSLSLLYGYYNKNLPDRNFMGLMFNAHIFLQSSFFAVVCIICWASPLINIRLHGLGKNGGSASPGPLDFPENNDGMSVGSEAGASRGGVFDSGSVLIKRSVSMPMGNDLEDNEKRGAHSFLITGALLGAVFGLIVALSNRPSFMGVKYPIAEYLHYNWGEALSMTVGFSLGGLVLGLVIKSLSKPANFSSISQTTLPQHTIARAVSIEQLNELAVREKEGKFGRLKELKGLLDDGIVTEEEFLAEKAKILRET